MFTGWKEISSDQLSGMFVKVSCFVLLCYLTVFGSVITSTLKVVLLCYTRVSTTPGNTGNAENLLEFEIPSGNAGNLLEFC